MVACPCRARVIIDHRPIEELIERVARNQDPASHPNAGDLPAPHRVNGLVLSDAKDPCGLGNGQYDGEKDVVA